MLPKLLYLLIGIVRIEEWGRVSNLEKIEFHHIAMKQLPEEDLNLLRYLA